MEQILNLINKTDSKYFGYCLKLTKNTEDAKDLLQDCLLKAWRFRDSFDGRSINAWFKRIIHNSFINDYRYNERHSDDKAKGYYSHVISVSDLYEGLNASNAIKELRENETKYACLLRYMEGYKYEEIAELYNLPIGTVKSRIYIGRKYFIQKYGN